MQRRRRNKRGSDASEPATSLQRQDELVPLEEAAKGLTYPSEADAPLEPFHWPADSGASAAEVVAKQAGRGRKAEEVSLDQFFAELEGTEQAERFRRLRKAAESA